MSSFNGSAQFHAEDPTSTDLAPFPSCAPAEPDEPGATGWASAYSAFPDREGGGASSLSPATITPPGDGSVGSDPDLFD